MNEKRTYWRLKNRMETPPGGWVWRDKDTKILLRSVNLEGLWRLVNRHRKQNGLSEYASIAEFEDDFCRTRVDARLCIVPNSEMEVANKRRLDDNLEFRVLSETERALNEWKKSGYVQKSIDKVESDCLVCTKCVHNKALICTSCLGYDTWVYGYLQHCEHTVLVNDVKICELDRVMIIVDVYRGDNLKEKRKDEYPEWCWKSK